MRRLVLVCALGGPVSGCDAEPPPDPLPELQDGSATDGDDEPAAGTDGTDEPDFPYPGGSDSGDDPSGGDPTDGGADGGDSSPGSGDDGNDSDGDPPPLDDPCTTQAKNLIPQGFVHASSVYSTFLGGELYPAELSVDGDLTTSWFSEGPETDGEVSTFEWYVQHDHCIDRITIIGNGDNAEPAFQTGYGYETLLVEVFDASGDVVFEMDIDLQGTPDPTVDLDLEGVLAHRVLLSFRDHESIECGGFAELQIEGREKTG